MSNHSASRKTRPLIGISACLQGDAVRYDGKDKLQQHLISDLSPFVDWLGFCPEMSAGLGVPRPPVKLFLTDDGIRAQNIALDIDCTDALTHTSVQFWQSKKQTLSGYIVKSRSPSCGLESTPVFTKGENNKEGQQSDLASGLFARELKQFCPNLPVADEEWLALPAHRWRFLAACYLFWMRQKPEFDNHSLWVLCDDLLATEQDQITTLLNGKENSVLDAALSNYWQREMETEE